MGCSRDDDASFERGSGTWSKPVKMHHDLPQACDLRAIRHVRTTHYGPGLYKVEFTKAMEVDITAYWAESYRGDETGANAYHMRLVTAARAAQVFKPTITETTRV